MGTESMESGWHVLRGNAQDGPLTWDELAGRARAGEVAADDLVWHPTLTDWVPARSVPNLIVAVPPAPEATRSESPNQARTTGGDAGGTPTRRSKAPLIAAVAAVVLGLAGIAAFLLLGGADGTPGSVAADTSTTTPTVTDMYAPPEPDDIVPTEAWGPVPIDQLGVVLADGRSRPDAEALAAELGGSVAGEMEYLNLYQLKVPATTEGELAALLEKAAASPAVELAFPNQESLPDEEIWGVRVSPLNDPVYQGENARPYDMIGVERAWNLIRGLGPELSEVHVGVTDDGLFRDQGEFGSAVSVEAAEEGDELAAANKDKAGNVKAYGSHGTAVTGIIAADPDNGGQTGVASVLGDKLKVQMTNIWGPKYGQNTPVAADPADTTQIEFANGTYAMGDLLALKAQVDKGATIINCSWGNSNAHPAVASAYRKFFEKMSKDHPNVLFVCSAGNDGKALDGTKRYPSGLDLPNMITVGCLDNDGSRVNYSNKKSANFEVTLAAPGHRVVSGVGADGTVSNFNGGTSFATPQVTAAAAMLRSLNPKLSAGDIKKILTETAGPGVTAPNGEVSIPFPHEELGAGVLRVDQAVLKVINDLRGEKGEPPFALEDLEKLGVVDAVAVTTDVPTDYLVRGILEGVAAGGTDLTISLSGQGAIGGKTSQHLGSGGEVVWDVTAMDESNTITVRRKDNGAASIITIETIDLSGHWAGTFTFGSVELDAETRAGLESQGCDLSALDELEGQSVPLTLDVTADPGGTGSATVFADFSSVIEDSDAGEPTTLPLQWSGNHLRIIGDTADAGTLEGTAARQGDALVLNGTYHQAADGVSITGSWTATKAGQ